MPFRMLALLTLVLLGCQEGGPAPRRPATRAVAAVAPAPEEEVNHTANYRLLFIGNSHTSWHDLPALVRTMILRLQPGKTVGVKLLSVGFLDEVPRNPDYLRAVGTGRWTHVILQAQRISQSGRHEYSRTEALDLAKLAKGKGARVIFYPEWGLKGIAGDGARQEKVYREMAQAAEVELAPVATAWDLALAEQAELPLHSADGNHQSPLGAFLTAAVLAGKITGESPAALAELNHAAANAKQRQFLTAKAAQALAKKP